MLCGTVADLAPSLMSFVSGEEASCGDVAGVDCGGADSDFGYVGSGAEGVRPLGYVVAFGSCSVGVFGCIGCIGCIGCGGD